MTPISRNRLAQELQCLPFPKDLIPIVASYAEETFARIQEDLFKRLREIAGDLCPLTRIPEKEKERTAAQLIRIRAALVRDESKFGSKQRESVAVFSNLIDTYFMCLGIDIPFE